MVQIVGYKEFQNEDGKQFYSLIVQGGVEAVVSKVTGRTYLTVNKASVSCTFDEPTCKSLIGTSLEGKIAKVEVEPYSYIDEETGEVVERNHRNVFMSDEEAAMNEHVIQEEI